MALLIGDGHVRGPRHREGASFGAEDDVLEAVRGSTRRPQVAGVVPPLGKAVVRPVIAWEDQRLGIGQGGGTGTWPCHQRMRRGRVGQHGPVRRARAEHERGEDRHDDGLDQGRPFDDRQPGRDPAGQPGRHPPVPVAEETHGGRYEEGPHDGRVERDGYRHAEAERLDEHDLREDERAGHDDHDEGRARDDPAAALEPACDRRAVVGAGVIGLLHAAEQEDLVVHRQAEQDAEEDDRLGRLHVAQRLEADQRRQVPVLEDPHQRTEAGDDREAVHDQRLERQHHRPQQQEQHEVGGDEDEQGRAGEVLAHPGDHVGHLGRASRDLDRKTGRRGQCGGRIA